MIYLQPGHDRVLIMDQISQIPCQGISIDSLERQHNETFLAPEFIVSDKNQPFVSSSFENYPFLKSHTFDAGIKKFNNNPFQPQPLPASASESINP